MSDKIEQFVEVLYPYIIKKVKQDGYFKNVVKSKNATVTAVPDEINLNKTINIKFPYDVAEITVKNETGEILSVGDTVCVEYWVDLKNAVAVYKVN